MNAEGLTTLIGEESSKSKERQSALMRRKLKNKNNEKEATKLEIICFREQSHVTNIWPNMAKLP